MRFNEILPELAAVVVGTLVLGIALGAWMAARRPDWFGRPKR